MAAAGTCIHMYVVTHNTGLPVALPLTACVSSCKEASPLASVPLALLGNSRGERWYTWPTACTRSKGKNVPLLADSHLVDLKVLQGQLLLHVTNLVHLLQHVGVACTPRRQICSAWSECHNQPRPQAPLPHVKFFFRAWEGSLGTGLLPTSSFSHCVEKLCEKNVFLHSVRKAGEWSLGTRLCNNQNSV